MHAESSQSPDQELINNLPKGLLKWIFFNPGQQALFITSGSSLERTLEDTLAEAGLSVTSVPYSDLDAQLAKAAFDYVFVGAALEYCKGDGSAASMLEVARRVLKPGGKLLLFFDNRLGIRYFCGDADPCTGIIFDGIENYPRAVRGRKQRLLYDKAEVTALLDSVGFACHKFYAVFPDLRAPQLLVADGYFPNEELDVRLFPAYNRADSVFLKEELLYSSLVRNQLFHSMANAFLVECVSDETYKDSLEKADYVTLSMDRGTQRSFATIVIGKERVIKKPLYADGIEALEAIEANARKLEQRGIPVAKGIIQDSAYVSEYIEGDSLVTSLRDLLCRDTQAFLAQLDMLWKYIIDSSESIPYADVNWENIDPSWDDLEKMGVRVDRSQWRRIALVNGGYDEVFGPILEEGFFDLVVLNAIASHNGPIFFDQEFTIPSFPARCIMLRNIDLIYRDQTLETIYPSRALYERYGIALHEQLYRSIENHIWRELVNFDTLTEYRSTRERNMGSVAMNRFCMNQAQRVRNAIMTDIFVDAADKDLYIFGAGRWADKFMAMYRNEYKISGIVDNDPHRQGSLMHGLTIENPDILRYLDKERTKVIICVKDCALIVRQLLDWGIKNIGVYNAWLPYPQHKKRQTFSALNPLTEKKKYRIGYVAGVFDLFHIGHLNLLRRAKAECEYLIVGVVTDEGVRRNKHIEPVIPFEQRLAVVQGCRYVDEAVEIPLIYCDTQDAWRKYQFDVQFSGSDYEHDHLWLEKQRFLRAHGSDLVFFPYTETTSSTQIKREITFRGNQN